MKACTISGILLLFLLAAVPALGKDTHATVVYDDRATEVTPATAAGESASDLWLSSGDLKSATGFEVKPQGVCRAELCFPLPKARMKDFLRDEKGTDAHAKGSWFNLTAFAALVHQPFAHDDAVGMWYFGLRADQQQRLASLRAPDFTLPDMSGKMHSLSDFRGKKVFLITWASW